ncbi:unnamed protein product [Lampetra planeri]
MAAARKGAAESTVGVPAVEATQSVGTISQVNQMAAKSTLAPAARERAPDRPQQMTPMKEFVAAGGDRGIFTRSFEAAYQAIGWTEEEALRASVSTLDDDVLPVFRAVPGETKGYTTKRQLNETALDSLVMEKLLGLAQVMGVMLPIVEEAQISCGGMDR